MKLSLQLKPSQQLTMTPQLQQAIKLLQLSTLDLQQEIHEAIESNPMLEFTEESAEDESPNEDTGISQNRESDGIVGNLEVAKTNLLPSIYVLFAVYLSILF